MADRHSSSLCSGTSSMRSSVRGFCSEGSSIMALTKEASALAASYAPYDLEATKAHVEQCLPDTTPARFRRFFRAQAFDRLFVTCLLYFIARFHHEALQQALLKAQRQHHERLQPRIVAAKLDELILKAAEHLDALVPQYAAVVLDHSRARHDHSDNAFFESLLETLILCLVDAFNGKHRRPVELEVGRLFRTPSFNCYARQYQGPQARDMLSIQELHAILHKPPGSEQLSPVLVASLRGPADSRPPPAYGSCSTLIGMRVSLGGIIRGGSKLVQHAGNTLPAFMATGKQERGLGHTSFAAAFLKSGRPASQETVDFQTSTVLAHFAKKEAGKAAYTDARLAGASEAVGYMPPLLEPATRPESALSGQFGGTMSRTTARQAGEGHRLANYTVHVAENGTVENEITLEMSRLLRNLLQANLGHGGAV